MATVTHHAFSVEFKSKRGKAYAFHSLGLNIALTSFSNQIIRVKYQGLETLGALTV